MSERMQNHAEKWNFMEHFFIKNQTNQFNRPTIKDRSVGEKIQDLYRLEATLGYTFL